MQEGSIHTKYDALAQARARTTPYNSFRNTSHPQTAHRIPGPTLGNPRNTFKPTALLWQIIPCSPQPCSLSVLFQSSPRAWQSRFLHDFTAEGEGRHTAVWPKHTWALNASLADIFSLIFCHFSYFIPDTQLVVLLLVPSEGESPILYTSCSFTPGICVAVSWLEPSLIQSCPLPGSQVHD